MVAYNYYIDYEPYPSIFGLGATGPSQGSKIASIAASGAATTGAMLSAAGISAMAGPIGLGVSAAIAIGLAIANLFQGCGDTCVEATKIANQAAQLAVQNLQAYQAIPAPRYKSIQAAYLNNFDTIWSAMQQACSDPNLGDAGKRCISERIRGGSAPWCPNPGHVGCDMFTTLRDPIANDPNVVSDPTSTSIASGIISSLIPSGSGLPLLPILLLAVGGLMFMGSER